MNSDNQRVVLALDTSTDMLCCAVGAVALPTAKADDDNASPDTTMTPLASNDTVDTAADHTGVAPNVTLLAQGDHLCRRQSNVELVNTALDTLAAAGLSMADVDAVLVGRGPGSFTGVRIGIATAKGLSRGLGVPLYGVSTLDATAWQAWACDLRGTVGVVSDAMRGEVYPGIYQLSDAGVTRSFATETVAKAAVAAEAWSNAFAERQTDITLTGDGLAKYRDTFVAAGFASIADASIWHPTGEGMLRAFATASVADRELPHMNGNPAFVLPIYTRLSDAEENERRRLGMSEPASAKVTGVADALANTHVQLRPAGINDVGALAALEANTYARTAHRAWTAEQIYEDISTPGSTWWVAHDAGTVIGFAAATLAGDNADVTDVVVAKDHRRRGIARKLLARVCYDMQVLGANTATLEVDEGNAAACALYANVGFTEVGRRTGYYAAGDGPSHDALVLRASLPLASDDVPRTQRKDDTYDHKTNDQRCEGTHANDTPSVTSAGDIKTTASTVPKLQPLTNNIEHKIEIVTNKVSNNTISTINVLVSQKELVSDGVQTQPETDARDARAARIAAASPLVLAIETSCDETAMAVIDGSGAILANVVATQIDFHARFGGVVPEIASRKHTEAIVGVYDEAMALAGERLGVGTLTAKDLAGVGVTAGPGLVGALVVGVAFAKGLAAATGCALVPVHHLEGHLVANLFATPTLAPPFVASLVSGGNTMLVHVRGWGDYHILGSTIDDAVGEAFDKVAKALGLGYPGGPVISRLAATGNPRAIAFPRAMMQSGDYRFSLSGLKTAVITYIERENAAGRAVNLPDLAASFTAAVVDVQVAKAVRAVDECGVGDFCVGGGVAANPQLRAAYEQEFGKRGVRVTCAPLVVCGDNGAMIAACALRNLRAGVVADLALDADPNATLGTWTSANVAPVVDAAAWPSSD